MMSRFPNANVGCLVCSHVFYKTKAATFAARNQNGWVVSCSENCEDLTSGEGLEMVHLECTLSMSVPDDIMHLPVNFRMDYNGKQWVINYFEDDFEQEEGLLVAPPKASKLRNIPNDRDIYCAFESYGPATVTLDEGTVLVPFWTTERNSRNFAKAIGHDIDLRQVTFDELANFAKTNKIFYLSPDFLCLDYDLAILAK